MVIARLLGLATGGGWIPLAVAFVLGAALSGAGTWRVMQWHVNEVVAERDAATLASDLHAQDAARWHAASDVRDGAIGILNTKLAEQSAAIDAVRVDNAKLDAINTKFAADLRTARDAVNETQTKDDARQHPEEVHKLGAVACSQYRRLYGPAAACVN